MDNKTKKTVYLDYAATSPMYPEAAAEMYRMLKDEYGNPSAVYDSATHAREAINEARRTIAKTLNTEMDTIFFTSGGTESDNWALIGTAEAALRAGKGNHIVTSSIEHPAVLKTCRYLEQRGFRITYLPVDKEGFIDLAQLKRAIDSETVLVSIMAANNEIGTIEPIREAAELAHQKGSLFHTDAVQAYLHIPIDVKQDGIDMLSASGHKFGGPKGTGFLYIRRNLEIDSLIHGGSQERNHRAGTENTAGITAMAKAAAIAHSRMDEDERRISSLKSYMLGKLMRLPEIPELNGISIELNGTPDVIKRLPGNLNICFRGINGESILILLDMAGIAASAGSACSSGATDPSYVLTGIGLSKKDAESSVRFTLGRDTTE
ncbi:MAG: cysteine desulfurase, partial [Clostridiales bacterium]|nr:cysteine desulfurase [Clostridiales bacterium]